MIKVFPDTDRHLHKPQIKVARIMGALDYGGAEMRTLELLKPLSNLGFEVHFFTLSGRAGPLAPEAVRAGASVHPLRLGPGFAWHFVRMLKELDIDVVHSDVATFSGLIVALGKIAGVRKRIVHFRSDGDGRQDTFLRRVQRATMRRLIYRFSTDILGVSPGAIEHGYAFRWAEDQRCQVIPNGVDLARLDQPGTHDLRTIFDLGSEERILLHVGRPAAEKRRWVIPQIMESLIEAGVNVHTVFVGPRDRVDEARLMREAVKSKVADRIHFIGATQQIGGVLAQADALILPSDREGLPGVVLEALAVGTPVVSSDLPGSRFIADRLSGLKLVPADHPAAAWRDVLLETIEAPLDEATRKVARRLFEDSCFTLQASSEAFAKVYRQLGQRDAT